MAFQNNRQSACVIKVHVGDDNGGKFSGLKMLLHHDGIGAVGAIHEIRFAANFKIGDT